MLVTRVHSELCHVSFLPPSGMGQQPAGCMWPLQPFLCSLSHVLGISQCKKGRIFLPLRSTDINVCTLSKRNILMKQKCRRCRPVKLKSHYVFKVHCFIFKPNENRTV
jgi:hypothetical protein